VSNLNSASRLLGFCVVADVTTAEMVVSDWVPADIAIDESVVGRLHVVTDKLGVMTEVFVELLTGILVRDVVDNG
jgi:hypothetical protein